MPIDLRRRVRATTMRYSQSIDYSHSVAAGAVASVTGGGALASETDLLLEGSSTSSPATSKASNEWRALFDMVDTDRSGAIGKHELKEAFTRVGTTASDAAIDALIAEVDRDGNGEIGESRL